MEGNYQDAARPARRLTHLMMMLMTSFSASRSSCWFLSLERRYMILPHWRWFYGTRSREKCLHQPPSNRYKSFSSLPYIQVPYLPPIDTSPFIYSHRYKFLSSLPWIKVPFLSWIDTSPVPLSHRYSLSSFP